MSQDRRIEKIIDLMRRDDSIDAPDDAIKWIRNLFLTRAQKPSLVRRLKAMLQIDLLPGQTVAGERSGAAATERQMWFNAGENAIDLRIRGKGQMKQIRGQILGTSFEGALVELTGIETSWSAKVSENGSFEFRRVPSGKINLSIRSAVSEIQTGDIEL